MRPQISAGFGEQNFNPKNPDKATLYLPGEVKGTLTAITSKKPEEREFVVDSGASMHMMSKKRIKLRRIVDGKKGPEPQL